MGQPDKAGASSTLSPGPWHTLYDLDNESLITANNELLPDVKSFAMPDLLVNLLKLPSLERSGEKQFSIRRAQPFEATMVRSFIEQHFTVSWADETSVGFAHQPVTVFIATIDHSLVGFAAYECTRRGFFGPTGVVDHARGLGIGKALVLASLHAMRELGYVYAIIGGAGPVDFYQRTVAAIPIPESEPGIYTDFLKSD